MIVIICGEGTPDIGWVEAGDAAKHPTYKTSPHNRIIWPQTSSVLVEKPGLRELTLCAAADARRSMRFAHAVQNPLPPLQGLSTYLLS